MSLYFDISELSTAPERTGIQRISGELCRYFPPDAAIPVRLEGGCYVKLPSRLIAAIGGYFRDASPFSLDAIARLSAESGPAIQMTSEDIVLIPEIFGERRAAFFRTMPQRHFQRCRFIIYDVLPFTHPEYFPPDMSFVMGGYYQVVRKASCCGFISEHTRSVYYDRLKRSRERGGVVLPLGCDSLGSRPTQPILNRPATFSVLGTIEPRKNHELILDAFEPLLGRVKGLTLEFIGKMGHVDAAFAERVHRLSDDANSRFRFYPTPDDGAIREHVQNARATVYVSAAEGYGLPPVESLWLGTPVIASTNTPSLEGLASKGIQFVDPLTVENLRDAIIRFLDDSYVNTKTEEAMNLDLPTWQSFSREVLRWCQM